MKTIGILFLIICTQKTVFGQNQTNPVKPCNLEYSGTQWTVTHSDGDHKSCQSVIIKSVPPVSKAYTPIDLTMTVKGVYSIRKDPSLSLESDYEVVIEDLLTGQYFDLNSEGAYSFNVNRASGDKRLVLEINKKKSGNGSTVMR